MSFPHRLSPGTPVSRLARDPRPKQPPSGFPRSSTRSIPLTRRYEVSWCDDTGEIHNFNRIAPASPLFEAAFSGFTHGALIATTQGPVAIEDLEPGAMIETANGAQVKLRWIGSIMLVPGAPSSQDVPDRLYRVTTDAFGLGRPGGDVTLGPAARLLNRHPTARAAMGAEAVLSPASDFADGNAVIEIAPVTPIRVYHLAFDAHHVLLANGLEVESFHPGATAADELSHEMQHLFVSLFPHIDPSRGFGRMLWPRTEAQV